MEDTVYKLFMIIEATLFVMWISFIIYVNKREEE